MAHVVPSAGGKDRYEQRFCLPGTRQNMYRQYWSGALFYQKKVILKTLMKVISTLKLRDMSLVQVKQ